MNVRLTVFTTPLLLAVALCSSLALATDKKAEEPAKPNCPKGQVWDSKSQRCVMQTSSLPPLYRTL
jgi:hypothetical protein